MDEKLQHFVALLNDRPPPARMAGRRASAAAPWGQRALILAGVVASALAAAAGGWWLLRGEGFGGEPGAGATVQPPSPAVVVASAPAVSGPRAPATPTAAALRPTPEPALATQPTPAPSAAVGDEASLAPSTVAAPTGPGPGADLSVVPPPELASLPPASTERPSGVPPWIRNAVAPPPRDGLPRIVLVIDDMGVDRKRSDRAVALPGPLTLSYLPYAKDLRRQTQAAHRAGHELMVHVPMEPFGHVSDAWPDQLEVSLSHEEVLRRLRWDLSRFDGYVGVNNHMGSKFTSDEEALRPVIEELRARGLLFLDSRTAPHSFGVPLARELGVPEAGRDIFLDDEITVPAIEAQLAEFERVAKRNGIAIAIGHPHDPTLDVLDHWLRTLPQRGLQLVPLSAVVRARAG